MLTSRRFVGELITTWVGVALIGVALAWGSDGVSAARTGKAVAGGLIGVAGAILIHAATSRREEAASSQTAAQD